MDDRDHFAAAALTGLLAHGDDGSFSEESYARAAYRWADAMLRERDASAEKCSDVRDSRTANTTDHDAAPEARAESERLREAIRRLADQDATLSVQGGNVIVEMDATLTDAEREAIHYVVGDVADITGPVEDILRGLLKRLA